MNRQVATTVFAVAAAFAAGLGWSWYSGGQQGGVAIVDLDKVARELGRTEQMSNSIITTANALRGTLAKVEQDAVQKLTNYRSQLGEQPTQEQAQNFQNLQRSAQLQFNQLKQRADATLSQHQQNLVTEFRTQTKPLAQRIAKEKGLTTVITANDTVVFAFDDAVDITDEVVALMKAEQPAPAAAAAAAAAPASQPAATNQSTAAAPAAAAFPPAEQPDGEALPPAPIPEPVQEAAAPATTQPQ